MYCVCNGHQWTVGGIYGGMKPFIPFLTKARSSLYPASAGSQEEEDDEDEAEGEGSGTAPCHCHNQAPTGFPIGTCAVRVFG